MNLEVVKYKVMQISETANSFYFHQYINFEIKNKVNDECMFFKKMHVITDVYKKNDLKQLNYFKKLINSFFNRSKIGSKTVNCLNINDTEIDIVLEDKSMFSYDCRTFDVYEPQINTLHPVFEEDKKYIKK